MSESKNVVSISGEVQNETRISSFGNGGKVGNNVIAVVDERGIATYVPIVGWYERVEEMESLRPGERVLVDGQLRWSKPWKDRDGVEKPGRLEVQVGTITVIGSKAGEAESVGQYVDTEKIKFT